MTSSEAGSEEDIEDLLPESLEGVNGSPVASLGLLILSREGSSSPPTGLAFVYSIPITLI